MNYPVPMSTPRENAKFLDNVRLNKFITEYQQMINVAMAYHGATEDQLLVRINGQPFGTKSHIHHPCSVWVRTNRSNFCHAVRSLLEFYNEHIARGGKGHINVKNNAKKAIDFAVNIPRGRLTPFVNAAANSDLGVSFKHIKDVHLAYQLYMNERWDMDKKEPKWTYGK